MVTFNKEIAMKTEFKTVTKLPPLEEMQKFVGGYVERLRLKNGHTLYVNEDGRLNGLPTNKIATALWNANWNTGYRIVGNVIYHCMENKDG